MCQFVTLTVSKCEAETHFTAKFHGTEDALLKADSSLVERAKGAPFRFATALACSREATFKIDFLGFSGAENRSAGTIFEPMANGFK